MARPKKWRKIESIPEYTYFKPCGMPKSKIKEVQLNIEEIEAMRLKDIEGLSQIECAERMSVSRQTFQLIIDSARNKVATALTEGKGIRIEGGNYTYNICRFKCLTCDTSFEMNYEGDPVCPKCQSEDVTCEECDDFCKEKCKKKD